MTSHARSERGQLRKPMPPVASEEERTEPKRGLTHKRVSNRKLKELLGYGLTYPTFREGYIAEIKRLGNLAQ